MTIRWKISVLVATLFAVLAVAEFVVARNVLMPSFTALEMREANVAMRRIDFAVERDFDQLAQAARSWGNWFDTYQFVQDHNERYIRDNINPMGLKESVAEVAIVEDLNGRILTSAAFDLQSGRPLPLQLARAQKMSPAFPTAEDMRNPTPVSGFVPTEHGVLMLAAFPILDGVLHGPSRGAVVMGRFLSEQEVARMGAHAQAQLTMSVPTSSRTEPRILQTSAATKVSKTFRDVLGRPIVTLTVALPRDITAMGQSAIFYASLYLAAAAVVVLIVLAIVLNRIVLGPLGRMTRHALEIGRNEDLTTRLDLKAEDEIGLLAREFDRMVARVAESRAQLIDQSFKAGFAEVAKGVLHNLGNAMTPIGVRVALLRTHLHAISPEEIQLAATELAAPSADPARKADLTEFLQLACAELSSSIEAARQDVEVITRQASLVQQALAAQMRTTGGECVMESVRLPDLVEQTLDVVPDLARQLLQVRVDQCLHEIGVVNVPRTVLSLVLQNFIINAAEAVREAGRTQGVLWVSGEILLERETRQLLIRCKDDGVGIARENLERIFEKGFSTKSRDTNFGIGLHWCANAIGALGGRVWAASDGMGKGATLHVSFPLRAADNLPLTRAA